MKRCQRCGGPLPTSTRRQCDDCNTVSRQEIIQENNRGLKKKKRNLAYKYGITLKEYEAMLVACEGKCEACQRKPEELWLLNVDHNHETGEVRGMLCRDCNVALGLLKDDPQRVAGLSVYLDKTT